MSKGIIKDRVLRDRILFVAFTLMGLGWINRADGGFPEILLGCCLIMLGLACLLGSSKKKVDNQEKE